MEVKFRLVDTRDGTGSPVKIEVFFSGSWQDLSDAVCGIDTWHANFDNAKKALKGFEGDCLDQEKIEYL